MKNALVAQTLAPLKAQLTEQRDAILEALKPLQAERDAILAEMEPLQARLRAVDARIDAVERPVGGVALREIGNNLAAIARHEGAITLENGGQQ